MLFFEYVLAKKMLRSLEVMLGRSNSTGLPSITTVSVEKGVSTMLQSDAK